MSFASGLPTRSRWVDVYVAALSRAVSYAGDFVAATALALTLQASHASSGYAVAAIMLAATLPPVVLAPLTGRLADRVDSRTLLAVAGAAQAAICVALAYASGTAQIVALAALLGCGLAVTQPTLSALTPAMVVRDDLPKAAAIGQTATSVGMVVAPAIGGLLVGAYGLRVPMLVDAVSYLALVAAAFAIRTRRGGRRAAQAAGQAPGGAPRTWRLRSDRLLWPLMVVIGAVLGVLNVFTVVDVYFVRGTLHSSTTVYGVIEACYAATILVGAWWVAHRSSRGDAWLALATLALFGATSVIVAAVAAVPDVAVLAALWTVGGAVNGAFNVTIGVLLGRRVPAEVRGRVYAIFGSVVNGAGAVGLVAGGALVGALPPRALIGLSGLAGVLAVAAFTPRLLAAARTATATARTATATARTATATARTATAATAADSPAPGAAAGPADAPPGGAVPAGAGAAPAGEPAAV